MITQNIINVLAEKLKQKKLITGEYLKDENNENFQYIKGKFFSWETIDKTKTLNTGSGLFESIANILSYYVWNPSVDFKIATQLLVKDYTALWYACVGITKKDWKFQTQYQPAENYYRENGVDYIIRAYKKVYHNNIDKKTEFYYLITSYFGGIIENKLYKVNSLLLTDIKEVDLITIDETANLDPIIDTGLTKTFWKITDEEEQIPLIETVKDKVYSIDRKIMMLDTQFLQNVESFVLMKGITVPDKIVRDYNEWNKINFSDLWRYIVAETDASMEFVNNSNSLIKEAIDYEDRQIEKVASITNIPMDFLGGMWTAGAIGEWSRELLHGAFYKRIVWIRELFDTFITDIIDVIREQDKNLEDKYSRDDVFSKNSKDLVDELSVALSDRIISKKTAMKKYLWYTDEEVELEMQEIMNENTLTPTE